MGIANSPKFALHQSCQCHHITLCIVKGVFIQSSMVITGKTLSPHYPPFPFPFISTLLANQQLEETKPHKNAPDS